jgi:hypothetical protein
MFQRSTRLSMLALLLAAGACSDSTRRPWSSPTAPITTGPTNEPPAPPPGTLQPPAFPSVTRPARIYNAESVRYWAYHWSDLPSRYILYDDGDFELQYASARFGVFTYTGRYQELASDVADVSHLYFYFSWDGWSTAGSLGATGTLRGNVLDVTYNLSMLMSDFEPGLFVRAR